MPLILVTNDDGITSRGIRKLIEVAQMYGEVVVVAPDSPQSGMGHAITIGETLTLEKSDIFDGIVAYECSGTPADCIKMAKSIVLKGRKIDLVVSGINHGSNSSISVIYSGTMSAAIEAAIEEIPSIGFSLCDYDHQASLSHIDKSINEIFINVLKNGIPRGVALNVNFPQKQDQEIQGLKICRQSMCKWVDDFDKRKSPFGKTYYWMMGEFSTADNTEGTDGWALENNYVSIVPCQFDLTSYKALELLNQNWE